jgi:hypothetical protein
MQPDDQALVAGEANPLEQLLEVARTQFCRSTGGLGPAGEPDFFRFGHGYPRRPKPR